MKTGWRLKINLVTFGLLAIFLLYAMATQVLSILEDRYSVFAMAPDAGGVFTNQEVTYRGVSVGQVGRMQVVEDGVKIELLISEDTKIPAEDVRARVMFKSAVGEQFVDILPEGEGKPYLEDGDVIPQERTDIPVSTQELLTTLEAVLKGVPPEALKGAIDSLGEGLTGRGPELATILESSADLAELFAERAPEVEGIMRKGTTVGAAFLESREDFATAIHELVTVSETLENSTSDLHRLMIGANLTSDQIVALIRENRRDLHRFLIEFAEVNELQAQHAADLSGMFKHLPTALERVVDSFEPKTGLVRFGLVSDEHDEPEACAYYVNGEPVDQRSPTDRSWRWPPKNARCEKAAPEPEGSNASARSPARPEPEDAASDMLGDSETDEPALSARMSDWSWTLVYLNTLDPSE